MFQKSLIVILHLWIFSWLSIQSRIGLSLFYQSKKAETSDQSIDVYFDVLSLFSIQFRTGISQFSQSK